MSPSHTHMSTFFGINISDHSLMYGIAGVVTLVAAGVSVAVLASGSSSAAGEVAPFVAASTAQPDTAASTSITGRVEARTPLQAAAPVGGRIVRLVVQVGDRVQAGQVLAVLDGDAAGLRVEQSDNEVGRAQAVAQEREKAARRAESLLAAGAMSQAEAQAAKAEAQAARNALGAARAGLAIARKDASLHVVRAPGDGYVTARLAQLGSVATPGQQLFAIEGGVGQSIIAAVPQDLASSLRPGTSLAYDGAGESGAAIVEAVSPAIEQGGFVQARLAIRSGQPAPGAIVSLALGSPAKAAAGAGTSVVRVPLSAVQVDRGGTRFVYTIDPLSKARAVPVALTGTVGGDARVSGKLRPGTTVVASGGAFLREGQTVRLAKPAV